MRGLPRTRTPSTSGRPALAAAKVDRPAHQAAVRRDLDSLVDLDRPAGELLLDLREPLEQPLGTVEIAVGKRGVNGELGVKERVVALALAPVQTTSM